MNIFKQIKNSIYGKDYYRDTVLTENLGASIKYLLKISTIVALVFAIVFAVASPFISRGLKSGLSEAIGMYPDSLTIYIQNGNANINQPEPFFIKINDSIKNLNNSKDTTKKLDIENFIVINTTEPFNLDKFKSYKTLALLTKNEIVMMSNKGEIKIENLSVFGNVEITKTWLQGKEGKAHRILPWAFVGVDFLVFGGILLIEFVGSLIIMFLYALITWGLLKLKGIKITYQKSYQVAIHASTLILFFGIFTRGFNGIVFKILILVIVVYFNFDNIVKLEPKKEEIVELESEENK